MTRLVEFSFHEGCVEVSAWARTMPEALALEAAIRTVPKAEAFVPAALRAEVFEPEAAPIPDESALPPFVQADADDNVGGLLAGTAVEP